MNKIVFTGRWTKKPEIRYTQTGKPVGSCTIAVNREFKMENDPDADFFPVVIWGKQGEATAQYTDKGWLVCIEGRIQNRNYTDNEGAKRWITEVVANRVEFLAPPKNDNTNENKQSNQNTGNQQNNPPSVNQQDNGNIGDFGDFGSEISFNENDIPF